MGRRFSFYVMFHLAEFPKMNAIASGSAETAAKLLSTSGTQSLWMFNIYKMIHFIGVLFFFFLSMQMPVPQDLFYIVGICLTTLKKQN